MSQVHFLEKDNEVWLSHQVVNHAVHDICLRKLNFMSSLESATKVA